MPINDLPAFMRYFKVADEDDEFIEDMCDNLLILQEDEKLMKEGLGFDELLQILKSSNFLQGMEITERESVSVMCS